MLVAIQTPADNDRGPRYMEKVFAALHQAGGSRAALHLEYGSYGGGVGLFLRFPRARRSLILEPLAAKYPACRFAEVKAEEQQSTPSYWYADLQLTPELYPILRHSA